MSDTRKKPYSGRATRAVASDHEGFTIVEILVAMALLTIALTGLAALQTTTLRTAQSSRRTTTAATIAQKRIEEFRAANFNDITTVSEAVGSCTNAVCCFSHDGTADSGCANPSFYRSAQVTGDITNGFLISVTVQWDHSGLLRQYTAQAFRNP